MKRNHWLLLAVSALCLGAALSASAQTTPIDVELGYRWTEINGNEDVYRTQINESQGLLLRALTISSIDFGGGVAPLIDHFRLDMSDFGTDPASSLRIDTGLSNAYRFTMRYRKAAAFSSLPGFANPLGSVVSQHTFDRERDTIDADVEILRWSAFKPFIGYSWNRYEGPGTTTWHIGQDEFALSQSLHDTDREIRVGTGFDIGPVSGVVTQGWRSFSGRESLSLIPGAGNGNNPNPVLGTPVNVTNLTRSDRTDVDTPFTTLYVAGSVLSKLHLVGDYARFAADGDSVGSDDATGSLASFALSRFFKGLTESSTARTSNTTWRGGIRGEYSLNDKIDFTAGYRREHRDLDGSALIRTLYVQSVTFGGADPRDLEVILNASSSMEREEDVADATFAVRPIENLSIAGGVSESSTDITVSPDLSEIVVSGNQGGTFDRTVRSYFVNAGYSIAGLTVGGSVQRDDADDPILRTDFTDRDRYRLRAMWKAPRFLRAGLTADRTKQENDHADTQYDATLRQFTADVELMPFSALTLRASTSRFRSDSDVIIRLPQTLTTAQSSHREKGKSTEAGVTFAWQKFSFDGDVAHFDNEGSLPFDIDRIRGRVTLQVRENLGIGAELTKDNYNEDNLQIANYEGKRYGLFLRLRR